jgi:hypothetical protein
MNRARIWDYLDSWWEQSPDFFWVPDSQATLLLERKKGVFGYRVGSVLLTNGGIVNPRTGNETSITFDTSINLVNGESFIASLLVSVLDPAAVSGSLFKIGSSSNGWAFGAGNPYFESAASSGLVLLREGLAWGTASTSAWVRGVNVVSGGTTSDGWSKAYNSTTGVAADLNSPNINNASNYVSLNGYTSGNNRSSNIKVHAAAFWKRSLTTAQFESFRDARAREVAALQRLPREGMDRLFVPQRSVWVQFGPAAGGGTGDGAGGAAGVGAATGVGAALFAGVGSAAGVGTPTGVGASLFAGVGSAAGVGAATGAITAIKPTVGTAAGVGAATAVGSSVAAGSAIGTSAGVGAASGVGASIYAGIGTAAGISVANGIGSYLGTIGAVGSAAGTSTVTGVGSAFGLSIWTDVGVSAATWADVGSATSIWTDL